MTKVQKLTYLPTLANWLKNTVTKSANSKYYHRRLEEDLDFRTALLKELQILVHNAHEDARQRFRNALDIPYSLDPLEEEATPGIDTSIIDDFPRYLELTTLKGYFGEIMAAVIVENFNPLDEEWYIPAFPFRFHQSAYHALEKMRQEGGSPPTIIGRFGDDMLAFQRNKQGKITHILFCEAKCSAEHDQDLIAEAHVKANDTKPSPVDCFQLAEMLKDYAATNPEVKSWRQAIINLWFEKTTTHERCDLINYICGLPPVKSTTVIIPTDKPHVNYTVGRRLEAVEIHLHDVDGLIEEAYQAITQLISCNLTVEDLSTLWEKVILWSSNNKQSLNLDQCRLLAFDGRTAVVGVCSISQFREVQRRKADIRNAFLGSGIVKSDQSEGKIKFKIKLKVANLA
ncbi:hypothetical protein HW132_30945 [Brasilonema sp. CT11]|nr:hypothetical protein [Brasilonema sp. CT11]